MNTVQKAKALVRLAGKARDIRARRLRTLTVFTTDRCSSRCKHCLIWAKKPKHDLPLETVEALLSDRAVRPKTFVELTGGEFLEHPRHRDIVDLVSRSGLNYMVLSNGMYPDRLIELVREFKIPNVYMSLDGLGESYRRVRGVDNSDNVCRCIDSLKSETHLYVDYCITPWNRHEDLLAVKRLCEKKGVSFSIGVYQNLEFFDTTRDKLKVPAQALDLVDAFMRLHNPWMDNRLSLPCWNISTRCTVMPTGQVFLCQQKSVVLGDLAKGSLSGIWHSAATRATHLEYRRCNDCWLGCQRPFDAELAFALTLALPQSVLEKRFGPHSWNLVRRAYTGRE